MKNKGVRATVVVLVAIVALSFGLFVSQYMFRPHTVDMTAFHGTWLDKPREVSQFDLQGTKGAFTNASLEHHWTMMFFGFTTCPSICPTTMAELSKMIQLLQAQNVSPLPQVVLVSLDPKQDTLEKIKQYVTAFNPEFIGARSDNEAVVQSFAKEMGVAYARVNLPDNQSGQHYNIEHTGTVMLFNPQGKLTGFFTMPHHAESLVKDYQLAIQTAAKG